MTPYQRLTEHFKRIYHFEHFSALGDWDMATMMPDGGSSGRADAMATLAGHIHQLKTAPQIADWIDAAKQQELNIEQTANLREINYHYQQATMIPADLVEAKTQACFACEHAWRQQRQENDWQGFKPNLENIIELTKQEAQIRSEALGISPYDALLNKFEPGMGTAQLDDIFNQLQTWLPDLIQTITDKQAGLSQPDLSGHYPAEQQFELAKAVMTQLGFDFNQGRVDTSIHPFCGGVTGDIRLTTKFEPQDFSQGLLGVIHETGHALYEQGLPKAWYGQPAGMARSMAVHESQSLFFEMQLGASKGLLNQFEPLINQHLNVNFSSQALRQHFTRVKPGLIRIAADEVSYPCHIMLRFRAEKAMLDGSLQVADLPDFWDQQMQQLLGISTKGNYKDGCMQDIHWTFGELGYFPSYSLGAMYAAQLRFALEQQLGSSIDDLLANNQLDKIVGFLRDNIWSKASLFSTDELLTQATGQTLNSDFFKRHLTQRYID
ncbi:carboxypeptidase M32 [Shewanella marina]|uniref:carboxypeptidase M32 n=1 Tax=Shewanella marina TaxID=487319 RepID=UPI00047225C8|nr:carboxypeptidase M32 [Shewanella marina]